MIFNVQSFKKGIYYYHPYHHRLVLMDRKNKHQQLLLDVVKSKMPPPPLGDPGVIFVVTAILARTCWKYVGIPYHLILQEVGALYQTMYLVGTQLELGPCAIGAFPERAVNELLGLDSRDEAQVGLFALGVPRCTSESPVVLMIKGVRLVNGSPFSPSKNKRSLELEFQNGEKEIIDLDNLHLEWSADRRLTCHVIRGRYQAEFNKNSEAKLMSLLDKKDGWFFRKIRNPKRYL